MNFQPHISNGMPTAPVTIAAGIEGKRRISLTIIRRHRAVYFLPFRGRSAQRLHGDNRPESFGIWEAHWFARDSVKFEKRSQRFIGTHNETLPVISRNSGYRHMPRRAEKHGIAVLPGWLPWSRSRIPWIPRNLS